MSGRVVVSGTVRNVLEVEADTIAEGVALWQEEAGGGYPDSWEAVNDPDGAFGTIHGGCESCGDPIIEGEAYLEDEDTIMWHVRCDDRADVERLPPALLELLELAKDLRGIEQLRARVAMEYAAALASPPRTDADADFVRDVVESQNRAVGEEG